MNKTIIKLALRECAIWIVPVLIVIFGYVLFAVGPLRYWDSVFGVFGALLGFFLGFRIFADFGGVRPFLFSRPYSPARLFLVRWSVGMSIILSTVLLVGIIIATGLRQGIQTSLFDSGWFPMVRYMELESLYTLGVMSLLFYQTTVFFTVRARFLGAYKRKTKSRFVAAMRALTTVLLVLAGLGFGFLAIMLLGIDTLCAFDAPFYRMFLPLLLLVLGLPALLQTALIPLCGVYCYCNQEIES